jgi:catechol 2,3-dioxygenase-like lactoylglutathione lyase family enzyme
MIHRSPPPIDRILETTLYVADLDRSFEFYQRVFGFPAVDAGDRLRALNIRGSQILLLCRTGQCTEASLKETGTIPGHDGGGQIHLAFAIAGQEFETWRTWLTDQNVSIESTMDWPRGGRSLYFRDPDGHLLELVTPGTWEVY